MIQDFYLTKVRPRIEGRGFPANSIIDFAVCEDGERLWVIEVNPFLETTDGALFSWQQERPLLEGSQGFVFRITERPRPGARTILPQSVRALLV
ncbi:hypothetical protein DPMN_064749 [Dreissena polymorpha]|uniref:Uncharacterized protein n=1 Tax=Dreissena polymorpha TaxID=45954 RepID=A0A9D4HKD9_DREPO|nr:hypothetical protein DPMN_064749 [Dreissena polymorpha]